MVKAPVVGIDVAFGENILRYLDAAKFPISAAFWLLDDDEWNLIIATPHYEKLGLQNAYLRLREALSTEGPVVISSLPIRLFGNRSALIKGLRKTFGSTASVQGMRVGGHAIGGVWVDDAYVYRLKK